MTKNFFPNLELLNSGCGLSASAAYTPVFTVITFLSGARPRGHASNFRFFVMLLVCGDQKDRGLCGVDHESHESRVAWLETVRLKCFVSMNIDGELWCNFTAM